VSVRVGIGIGPFGDGGVPPGGFLRHVELIEELGYDSIWLSDAATMQAPAPLVALAAAAARTTRLKLGTSVLVAPARNAVLLAKELATVDVLSGGRLLPAFGLGIATEPEASAVGVPRAERAARTEEAIEIVRLLWRGAPVTYEGRFASLTEVTLTPAPTRPSLDIWLGGSSPAALRRTGRLADGWLGAFVSPEELAACVARIVEAADEAGREIEDDHYGTTLFAAASPSDLTPEALSLLRLRPGLALEDHVAIGAEALRELIERFVEAGASKFVVIPIAENVPPWLEELRIEAVAPIEARERVLRQPRAKERA
jgi:probable F420-dependent oxidoreductase